MSPLNLHQRGLHIHMTDYYETNGEESEYFDSFYTLPILAILDEREQGREEYSKTECTIFFHLPSPVNNLEEKI
jgi:hypothetical protein